MKIRIEKDGIYGMNGDAVPVGTEISTSLPLPAGWLHLVSILSDVSDEAVLVTNDLTREGIAAMEKPELLEWLDAHGWGGDKRLGVEKLREALTAAVFVDL